ncbi:hypothetical protein PIROE2DRAFT_61423 [Piromyces sp. E2]|nr:hypothetical protein PIROE2DRAFT_61423 [Piromyces sp. E2]|eukprot:OUM63210.1 hypothetical protein PIROE2DRAFT_61423 [Piromyces sp. E2]
MDDKEIKNKNKKEIKKNNINMDSNSKDFSVKNDKENSDNNKPLLEKKKKKKSISSNKKGLKNIGSMETVTSNSDNNNPNNTYILPPPVPKMKKQTKNLSQNDRLKNVDNESSLPPSVPLSTNSSPKVKKLSHTTKIKVHNPLREANTVHLIDGSKEIIFKKDRIESIDTNKDNNDKKTSKKNESIIIQPDEIYNENITESSELIYINDPNNNTEEETLIDIPPPNDLDVLYIEVGNKFRKVKGDDTNNFKMNEKETPKISDSHRILSYMKNADHLMKYFFLGVTMLFGGVCLLSLIIFPWSMPKASCEKDTTTIVPYEKISWEISKKDLMPTQKWQTERLLNDIKWWIRLNLIRDITGIIMCFLILIEMLMERSAKKKYRKLERNILLSKILNYENTLNPKNNKSENNNDALSSNFGSQELNYNRSIDNFTTSNHSINRIPLNQINK